MRNPDDENRRQQYRENRSAHMATIGALVWHCKVCTRGSHPLAWCGLVATWSCLLRQAYRPCKSVIFVDWLVERWQPGTGSAFMKWTKWTLAVAKQWWQLYKHCHLLLLLLLLLSLNKNGTRVIGVDSVLNGDMVSYWRETMCDGLDWFSEW